MFLPFDKDPACFRSSVIVKIIFYFSCYVVRIFVERSESIFYTLATLSRFCIIPCRGKIFTCKTPLGALCIDGQMIITASPQNLMISPPYRATCKAEPNTPPEIGGFFDEWEGGGVKNYFLLE